MRCPRCGSVLVVGPKKRFETLLEHCCNPNATPPLQDSYVCKECELPGFFNEYGEYYGMMFETPRRYWQALDSMEYDIKWEVESELREVLESLPDEVIE